MCIRDSPMPFIIFLITAAFMSLLLDRTPFGIQLYLLGSNPTATLFSGVNNRRVIFRVYLLCSFLAGVASVVMTCLLYTSRYLEKAQKLVNWKEIKAEATRVMDKLGVDIDPEIEVSRLSVADQQLVAISRAIAVDARFIILDEPTSSPVSYTHLDVYKRQA